MNNPFLLPVEHYNRNFEIVRGIVEDNAKYIQLMTNDPYDDCYQYVRSALKPDGEFPLKNPKCLVLERNQHGDREEKVVSFLGFVNRVKAQNLLISPSMAVYLPETIVKSTHAEYIREGVANRKVYKDKQIECERNNQTEDAMVNKGIQENLKQNNNSYSGATVSSATALYYKSTHSSLTSTCRTATSYANACNEKFIRGNRHYYNAEVLKANLVSLINPQNTDFVKLKECMEFFNLHYPTVDDVIEMVVYSSNHYGIHESTINQVRQMCTNMTPLERAAVLYISDLYHLYKHNKDFVIKFLFKLAEKGDLNDSVDKSTFKSYGGDVNILANFICFDDVCGRSPDKLMEEAPHVFDLIYATGHKVIKTLNEYKLLFDALWLTNNVPSSIHAFPACYRRAALVSDTDSTMFTLQYWVEQAFGKVVFTPDARRLSFGLIFLVSEMVMHILAIQSANMGVSKEKLRILAMKNEYFFEVLALTNRAKHYFASQDALEGVMFSEYRLERKGVGLRDSKVPPVINKKAEKLMIRIIETIKNEQLLDVKEILKEIADTEREITSSILEGKATYLTSGQVKNPSSYKSEEDNTTYKKHLQWNEVFGPSFGMADEPPYSFVKLNMNLGNRTSIEQWLTTIDDKHLVQRVKVWMMRDDIKAINTLHIPRSIVEAYGIPKPIIQAADTRSTVFNTMGSFYLIMESLNIFMVDKNNLKLFSDFY